MLSKSITRQHIRQQRQSLSMQQQQHASSQLIQQLLKLPELRSAKHIGLYWPNDGEISAVDLLGCRGSGSKCFYLPKVLDDGFLHFRPFSKKMRKNCYGIAEPITPRFIPLQKLDVILMPLVAFNRSGQRLGMGGGYYDRSLMFKRKQLWRAKPVLVGLAHDFQEVMALSHDSWDIPLSVIVTNKEIIRTRISV